MQELTVASLVTTDLALMVSGAINNSKHILSRQAINNRDITKTRHHRATKVLSDLGGAIAAAKIWLVCELNEIDYDWNLENKSFL